MSARLHAPSPPGSPSRRSVPAMSHRPFKKRDWDAELAKIGVPSDSPMRLIQRNGDSVGDEANNNIVAASEGDGAVAGADTGTVAGTHACSDRQPYAASQPRTNARADPRADAVAHTTAGVLRWAAQGRPRRRLPATTREPVRALRDRGGGA